MMEQLQSLVTLFLLIAGALSSVASGLLILGYWVLRINAPPKNIIIGAFQLSTGFFLTGVIFLALHVEKIWAISRNGKFGAFTRHDMPFFYWLFLSAYALIVYFQIKNGLSRIKEQNIASPSSGLH